MDPGSAVKYDEIGRKTQKRAQEIYRIVGVNDHQRDLTAERKGGNLQYQRSAQRQEGAQNPEEEKRISPVKDINADIEQADHNFSPQ